MHPLLGDDAEAHAQRLVHVLNQLESFGKEVSEEGLVDALRDGGLVEKVDTYMVRPLMRELGLRCGNTNHYAVTSAPASNKPVASALGPDSLRV